MPFAGGQLWAMIKGFAGGELSFGAAWQAARDAFGPSVTRDNFLSVWQGGSEFARKSDFIQSQPGSHVPTSQGIVDAPVNYGRTYAYTIRVDGNSILTGSPSSAHYIV